MNKILNKLSLDQSSNKNNLPVVCNYANNYYGDQVCVPMVTKHNSTEKKQSRLLV